MESVKNTIMASATLRKDFHACVNLFQDFIEHSGSETRVAHVASTSTKSGGGGSGRTTSHGGRGSTGNERLDESQADMSVPDRYYKGNEYKKLSAAEKLGLKIKRKRRGGSGRSNRRPSSQRNDEVKLSSASIKALATAVREADSDESDSESDGEETAPIIRFKPHQQGPKTQEHLR